MCDAFAAKQLDPKNRPLVYSCLFVKILKLFSVYSVSRIYPTYENAFHCGNKNNGWKFLVRIMMVKKMKTLCRNGKIMTR